MASGRQSDGVLPRGNENHHCYHRKPCAKKSIQVDTGRTSRFRFVHSMTTACFVRRWVRFTRPSAAHQWPMESVPHRFNARLGCNTYRYLLKLHRIRADNYFMVSRQVGFNTLRCIIAIFSCLGSIQQSHARGMDSERLRLGLWHSFKRSLQRRRSDGVNGATACLAMGVALTAILV